MSECSRFVNKDVMQSWFNEIDYFCRAHFLLFRLDLMLMSTGRQCRINLLHITLFVSILKYFIIFEKKYFWKLPFKSGLEGCP